MINRKILQQIEKWAVDKDWNEAFNGKSKGNRHLFRVNKIAKFLAQKEKADLNICLAGAWLHDVGLIFGNNGHEKAGLKISEKFLSSLNIPDEDRRKILHCIEAHEGTVKALTLEEKIVHDADVLDKIGLLGLIRHLWKLINTREDQDIEIVTNKTIKHLLWRQSQLQTETAKKISQIIDQRFNSCFHSKIELKSLVKNIIIDINKKLISDEIAKELINKKNIDKKTKKLLKSQLNCFFLKSIEKL